MTSRRHAAPRRDLPWPRRALVVASASVAALATAGAVAAAPRIQRSDAESVQVSQPDTPFVVFPLALPPSTTVRDLNQPVASRASAPTSSASASSSGTATGTATGTASSAATRTATASPTRPTTTTSAPATASATPTRTTSTPTTGASTPAASAPVAAEPNPNDATDPLSGADYGASCGTTVRAATPGRIELTKAAWAGGTLVKVTTSKSNVMTYYGHLQRIAVTHGQVVFSGQKLGEVGKAGADASCRAGAPGRLHFEVRRLDGKVELDPTGFLNSYVGKPVPSKLFGSNGFRIATFNVLGASHTARGGKAARLASGPVRMRRALALFGRTKADLIGLQEFQGSQRKVVVGNASDTYGIFPFTASAQTVNSILWRRSTFDYVNGGQFPVPYFGGRIKQMPWVLLRHKATGRMAYFMNVHNPADTRRYRHQQKWRNQAIKREIAQISALRKSGLPVFLTGDFNDKVEAYCPLTTRADMVTPIGGSPGASCNAPDSEDQAIDMIFASAENVAFTRYKLDKSTRGPVSDHPYVIARAHLADQ